MAAPNTDAPVVLVVDDESDILELLSYNFQQHGFTVHCAEDGGEALKRAQEVRPDVIVLDLMMPTMDGLEVCRRLRRDAHLRTTPVLVLTARSDDEHHVQGLDVGADAYLSKPAALPVIISQTKALLRSTERHTDPPDRLRIHDLEIDRDRFLVRQHNSGDRTEICFPRQEFELLYFLASHPGVAFSRDEILDAVWNADARVGPRTIDVHVRKIRQRIGRDYIETIQGVGYRFRA